MKVLRNPSWWVLLLLFCLHQLMERVLDVQIPFLNNHFDAFVSVPLLLGLHLAEQRRVFSVERLSWLHIAVATILFSIIFEVVFPYFQPLFTADWWDVVAYVLGAVYFACLINNK